MYLLLHRQTRRNRLLVDGIFPLLWRTDFATFFGPWTFRDNLFSTEAPEDDACPFCGKQIITGTKMLKPWGFAPVNGTCIQESEADSKMSFAEAPCYFGMPKNDMEETPYAKLIKANRSDEIITIRGPFLLLQIYWRYQTLQDFCREYCSSDVYRHSLDIYVLHKHTLDYCLVILTSLQHTLQAKYSLIISRKWSKLCLMLERCCKIITY